MRKKGVIVCVLVVILVLTMVGYNHISNAIIEKTRAEGNEINKLEFEEKGTYKTVAFGEEYYMYRFDKPNANIVVYKTLDGIYLVGEYGKESGISYGNIFMPEYEFIALSNEYLLFESEEGKVAVSLERRKNVKKDESFYDQYLYDDLSDKEKEAFVYPIVCKKIVY